MSKHKENRRQNTVTVESPALAKDVQPVAVIPVIHDACSNCRFWRGDPKGLGVGECRYNPPSVQAVLRVDYPGDGRHAVVNVIGDPALMTPRPPAAYWCGRHERME